MEEGVILCLTCRANINEGRKQTLAHHCDPVCFAAAQTLSPFALEVWRANLHKLTTMRATAMRGVNAGRGAL